METEDSEWNGLWLQTVPTFSRTITCFCVDGAVHVEPRADSQMPPVDYSWHGDQL